MVHPWDGGGGGGAEETPGPLRSLCRGVRGYWGCAPLHHAGASPRIPSIGHLSRWLQEAVGSQSPSTTCPASPAVPYAFPRGGLWASGGSASHWVLLSATDPQPAGESPLCQVALREAWDIMAALVGPGFPSLRVGNLRRELNAKKKPSCSFPPPPPRALCALGCVPSAPWQLTDLNPLPAAHTCTSTCTCMCAPACVHAATCVQKHKRTCACFACTLTSLAGACCLFPAQHQLLKKNPSEVFHCGAYEHTAPALASSPCLPRPGFGLRFSVPLGSGWALLSPGDPAPWEGWWGWMGPSGTQPMVPVARTVSFLLLNRAHFLLFTIRGPCYPVAVLVLASPSVP